MSEADFSGFTYGPLAQLVERRIEAPGSLVQFQYGPPKR